MTGQIILWTGTGMVRTRAQFAKEAMACQSLDNDEILNVR